MSASGAFRGAVAWSFVMTAGQQVITLVITFLLAALLGPEAVGTVTDIDPGEDMIEIAYDPAATPDPVAGVEPFEDGTGAAITLNGDVVLNVTSGDTGEATVSPSTLTFTAANWNQPQTVTVTGVDDAAETVEDAPRRYPAALAGQAMLPVGRGFGGERQRELAYRFGVNLVMHVLTGNYKSDQVHVPALLDRLGQ